MRLVVELDGAIHLDPMVQETDEERQAALAYLGLTVLRFRNVHDTEEALARIDQHLSEHRYEESATPPLPAARERGPGGEGKMRGTTIMALTLTLAIGGSEAQDALWKATPFTAEKGFTPGIEGPAVDKAGNIYAVNYARQGTIGKTTPDGKCEVYVELPEGSIGNGIRFDGAGVMYIADYTKHNVLRVDPQSRKVTVFAHEPKMNQPNDLAIASDGTLYASDPNWKEGTGQLWRIDRDGKVTRLAEGMGTTNGIEVSPDGKTLYVNESVQRSVWSFRLTPEKTLADKRLLHKFPDHAMDGMRCDVDGNLFITRHGKGTVVKMSPEGKILQEIDALGTKPSNLCFGGKDGRTVYVTEVDGGRLVSFRVDRPGLEWQRWR